jgi:hypothetical protein
MPLNLSLGEAMALVQDKLMGRKLETGREAAGEEDSLSAETLLLGGAASSASDAKVDVEADVESIGGDSLDGCVGEPIDWAKVQMPIDREADEDDGFGPSILQGQQDKPQKEARAAWQICSNVQDESMVHDSVGWGGVGGWGVEGANWWAGAGCFHTMLQEVLHDVLGGRPGLSEEVG